MLFLILTNLDEGFKLRPLYDVKHLSVYIIARVVMIDMPVSYVKTSPPFENQSF